MVRAVQYEKYFGDTEYNFDIYSLRSPFFSNLQRKVSKYKIKYLISSPLRIVAKKYNSIREKCILKKVKHHHLIYLTRIPSFSFHESLYSVNKNILIDVNDALWLPSFTNNGYYINFNKRLEMSLGVICENKFLFNYCVNKNPNSYIVPDSPQFELFEENNQQLNEKEKLIIGWIGSDGTVDSLYYIYEELERLFSEYKNIELRIVGASGKIPRFENVRYTSLPTYDQKMMIDEIRKMDIAIFPLFNNEDSIMRGALKVKVYMSGKCAIIAQNIGDNKEIINNGVNGYLVNNREEWYNNLKLLIENDDLREKFKENAINVIRERYTTKKCFDSLLDVFRCNLKIINSSNLTV